MSKRVQVNIRLDQDLIDEIDRLADEEAIDRSEMARRLLDTGLGAQRMRRALDAYRAGSVTSWRAAEVAGVSLYEMLDRIHDEGIAHELDPAVFDRVGVLVKDTAAVREAPATYGSDAQSGIEELREQFKPRTVTTLFVGESSPAGETHFYRANSNLFHATQAAFAEAFGDDAVSDGPRFLYEFQDHGCWLVDLVDHPVNHLEDEERETLVSEGVAGLAKTIAELAPTHIVAVKATVDDEVRSAMEVAGSDADLLALPFPVRQWRAKFVDQLAAAMRRWTRSG